MSVSHSRILKCYEDLQCSPWPYLLNIALKLLVAHRKRVEELLDGDCGALLAGVWRLLSDLPIVVKHQARSHLGRLMTRHNRNFTEKSIKG